MSTEQDDAPDGKPTPFSLIVCCVGVNHTFQFKHRASAMVQYNKIKNKNAEANEPLEIEDDFGVLCGMSRGEIKSFRLEDINRGHRANFGLKLAELYAAKDFQHLVDNKHTPLKMISARAPSLVRAQ